jgi:hypothetical protein
LSSNDLPVIRYPRSSSVIRLANCRNEIESIQNLNHLAWLDALSDSDQQLHIVMMEEHLQRLAHMLLPVSGLKATRAVHG